MAGEAKQKRIARCVGVIKEDIIKAKLFQLIKTV